MKKLSTSGKIYSFQSRIPDSGRGVFARQAIKKGELIESCPVIEIPENDLASLNESILVTYFFSFGKKKERLMIALGFGSLYNHSYKPNARYQENPKEGVIDFIAIQDIKNDEEITTNYNYGNPKNTNPLWFEEAL